MPQTMTADELLNVSIPGKRVELIRGVLRVMEAPGFRHGSVSASLAVALVPFVRAGKLGTVVAGDTGFILTQNPDTVRAPDIAFVRAERVPYPSPAGYLTGAPDLAVEVLSPNDRPGEVLTKVGDWLEAGARLVWIIDPARRVARVYRADGSDAVVREDEALVGEDVLPGYSCLLREILE